MVLFIHRHCGMTRQVCASHSGCHLCLPAKTQQRFAFASEHTAGRNQCNVMTQHLLGGESREQEDVLRLTDPLPSVIANSYTYVSRVRV